MAEKVNKLIDEAAQGLRHFIWDKLLTSEKIEKILDPRKEHGDRKWEDEVVAGLILQKFHEKHAEKEPLLYQIFADLTSVDKLCLDMAAMNYIIKTATKKQPDGSKSLDWNNEETYTPFIKELLNLIEYSIDENQQVDLKKAREWLSVRRWIGQPYLASQAAELLQNIGEIPAGLKKMLVSLANIAGEILDGLPLEEITAATAAFANSGQAFLEKMKNRRKQR